jgi:exopolysaccharide production protein ExoZ
MIWSLQILRFVAALMVTYYHAAGAICLATGSTGLFSSNFARVGQSGVDIFFVLSGVVIARTADGANAFDFAWRRIRRIVPFYYISSLPWLAIIAGGGLEWRSLVATYLFWPATDVTTFPFVPGAWTLCFEMLFYFSATLVLYDRRWLYCLLCFYSIAFFLRKSGPLFDFLGCPLILEFLLGVIISRSRMYRIGALGLPLGAALLLTEAVLGFNPISNLSRAFMYGFPAALIVYGTMQIYVKQSLWTYLGNASYSLYLTHPLIVTLAIGFVPKAPSYATFSLIITVAVSILLSWKVHELIERPLLTWFPRRISFLGTAGSNARLDAS